MGLCATQWKLAICQSQKVDNFSIQNLPLQNSLSAHVNSGKWRHLLDSETKLSCLDLAYVDKLAKDKICVKYLLVRKDLFDRTIDAKRLKTKVSKEAVRAFLTMITEKNHPKEVWVDKETEFAWEIKKLCKAGGKQIYSTMSKTKAAFADRPIRSPNKILYRYMEYNRYKYIHKLTHIVTTLNCRRNCSINYIAKSVKNFDFSTILYNKPLREVRKTKFNIGDRVRISKYNWPFRRCYRPQFTQEVFKIFAIFFQKTSNKHNNGWTRWDYPR